MVETQPRKLSDFEPLTAAEQKVLDELHTGQMTKLGNGGVPTTDAGDDRRLHAHFVRWLVLGCEGSEHRLHEKGLQVQGGLIVRPPREAEAPQLDLQGCRLEHGLAFVNCRFANAPRLDGARLRWLFLNGSVLPGLSADRIDAADGIFLCGAWVRGELRLGGARNGGDLNCIGARLFNNDGWALNADGLRAEGHIFLRGARVSGGVRLGRARIGGDFDCDDARLINRGRLALYADGLQTDGYVFLRRARIKGEVRMLAARIGLDLSCIGTTVSNPGAVAVNLGSTRIERGFYLRHDDSGRSARITGTLDLGVTEIGHINDHPDSWPEGAGSLILDRCVYGAFTGHAVSAQERLCWLRRQDASRFDQEFWPQPYEQCAKVLREMGHPEDAREILIEKERLQRAALRRRLRESGGLWARLQATWHGFWDPVLGATVRYGRQPLFAGWWLLGFWFLGFVVFQAAADAGAIKPNTPVVLRSAEWMACSPAYVAGPGQPPLRWRSSDASQLECFERQGEARSYPQFNAGLYSLDTLLPIVSMEMQGFWIPDDRNEPFGKLARWYLWWQIFVGWALSLLAVAGFSGLVKSD